MEATLAFERDDGVLLVVALDDGFDGPSGRLHVVPSLEEAAAANLAELRTPADQTNAGGKLILSHFLTRMVRFI